MHKHPSKAPPAKRELQISSPVVQEVVHGVDGMQAVLSGKNPDAVALARAGLDRGGAERAGKHPAAVALGRLGGLKGGRARAEKLTGERRSEIAKNAAEARWKQRKDGA